MAFTNLKQCFINCWLLLQIKSVSRLKIEQMSLPFSKEKYPKRITMGNVQCLFPFSSSHGNFLWLTMSGYLAALTPWQAVGIPLPQNPASG